MKLLRITIKHDVDSRLFRIIETLVHNELSTVVSGILKTQLTDGSKNWAELEFFIQDSAQSVDELHDCLLIAERYTGEALAYPVSTEALDAEF